MAGHGRIQLCAAGWLAKRPTLRFCRSCGFHPEAGAIALHPAYKPGGPPPMPATYPLQLPPAGQRLVLRARPPLAAQVGPAAAGHPAGGCGAVRP